MNKTKLLYAGVGLIISISSAIVIWGLSTDSGVNTSATVETVNTPVEMVGATSNANQVGTSWPGEIISNSSIEVQPQREGSIVEWRVKIGQRVSKGQVLARLSAPPATPELTLSLAEQAQNFTKARANAEAQNVFVEKNKKQLNDLRAQIVNSARQISDSLSDNYGSDRSQSLITLMNSLESARRDAGVKSQTVKDYSAQVVRKVLPEFTNYGSDPITAYQLYGNVAFNLRSGLGIMKPQTQTDFMQNTTFALKAIADDSEQSGEGVLRLLQSADALVANSYAVEDSVAGLTSLRTLVSDERALLSEKLKELTEANTEVAKIASDIAAKKIEFTLTTANANKEVAEKLKDIDEKLIDLDRELQLVRAEADASGVAYRTISNALIGGTVIVAPRSGIISTINKKNGDFVGPGMAVASINSANEKDRIVRFRIPGNLVPLQAGEVLTAIRPGFPKDGKKIKVVGSGLSLDGSGSFLADADFAESVAWPVGASVRVLPPINQSNYPLISLSAVWWNDDGRSSVWLVTEENKIRPQEVKTGRTLGDKIEILDGLAQGISIVSKATSDLKTGININNASTNKTDHASDEEQMNENQPHSHDE